VYWCELGPCTQHKVYLASALDASLKVYDEDFHLLSSMKWSQGPALSMVFNPTRDEVIVAGADGVCTYKCVNTNSEDTRDKFGAGYELLPSMPPPGKAGIGAEFRKQVEATTNAVGRCTLTPPDPQLKGAWFQTLTLEHQSWFQNVPFTFNLRRYNAAIKQLVADEEAARIRRKLANASSWRGCTSSNAVDA
jgi:hypothetical protein